MATEYSTILQLDLPILNSVNSKSQLFQSQGDYFLLSVTWCYLSYFETPLYISHYFSCPMRLQNSEVRLNLQQARAACQISTFSLGWAASKGCLSGSNFFPGLCSQQGLPARFHLFPWVVQPARAACQVPTFSLGCAASKGCLPGSNFFPGLCSQQGLPARFQVLPGVLSFTCLGPQS